ncbi:hypothetical protein LINGRAHAP2_LOCUS24468 [Linum grandiflorum]
MRQAG